MNRLAATEEELRSGYNDLVKSQCSLEDKETALNAILSQSPIAQFVIDRDHRILVLEPCACSAKQGNGA